MASSLFFPVVSGPGTSKMSMPRLLSVVRKLLKVAVGVIFRFS